MRAEIADLEALQAVASAGGFREAARVEGVSASSLSDAVRRLEAKLGVRLLNRTTRSLAPTEAGARLLARLGPALGEIEAALQGVHASRDRPAGALRLNVPVSAARLVLPRILPSFLLAYPDIRVEVEAQDAFVDLLATGFDVGVRYDEQLAADMIAVPIGPREQRYACAAAPAYLAAHPAPEHPKDLLAHRCLRNRFADRQPFAWEFARAEETIRIDPPATLVARTTAVDLVIDAALAGAGVIYLFEDWLRPHLASGALLAVLEPWWLRFSGPFLYYPGRRLTPPPLRAFIDHVRASGTWD